MNRTSLALLALTLACGTAHATGDNLALTFECAHVRLPRMADVSAVTGITNSSQTYATRELLLHQATRICRNPAVAFVRFVPDSQVAVAPLRALAAR